MIINSINFIDNMDGLTVIVSGSICLQIALLANYSNIYKLTDISLLLLATLLGFLIYNFPPAKLYFGDSGTLFVGYVLGFISLIYDWIPEAGSILISPFSPVLFIFTVPVLDFLVVTTDRISNNKSPTTGGTDHISHRLLNLGHSERKVLSEFLLLSFYFYILLIATIFFNGVLSVISAASYLIFFVFSFVFVIGSWGYIPVDMALLTFLWRTAGGRRDARGRVLSHTPPRAIPPLRGRS